MTRLVEGATMSRELFDALRELEGLFEPTCNLFKQQQDFYKTFLTLNTTTLLISVAFSEKMIRVPLNSLWALVPFVLFSLSLLSSLLMMRIFGEFEALFVEYRMDLLNMVMANKIDPIGAERLREKSAKIGKRANRYQGPALWFYFLGIIALIVFAVINLLGQK